MSDDTSLRDFLEQVTGPDKTSDRAEIERLRDEREHLQRALVSRSTIEQAKGIVMAAEGCPSDEAFQAMVTMSQELNIPLRDMAAALVYPASHQDPAHS